MSKTKPKRVDKNLKLSFKDLVILLYAIVKILAAFTTDGNTSIEKEIIDIKKMRYEISSSSSS